MLVDDLEDDIALMRFAFQRAGIKNPLCEMRDGEEAIAYLSGEGEYADRERYPLPCLIITDLKMPRVDGFQLLAWLRPQSEFHRVPRIVLTASGHERDEKRARELGGCAYFIKPSQLNQLVQIVKELDNDWISENCPLESVT